MSITTGLLADVRVLVDQLDLDATVIVEPLTALRRQLAGMVGSFAGLRLTIGPAHHPIVLSDFATEAAALGARTSLTIPLAVIAAVPTEGEIIFWAEQPGAFVDLAADLRFALDLAQDSLPLDQRPQPLAPFNAVSGMAERSSINQALGVLIDRGRTPDAALAELRRQAAVEPPTTLAEAALTILRSVRPVDPD